MNPAPLAISLLAVALLNGCAPEDEHEERRAPGPALGYELASADSAATDFVSRVAAFD